MAITSERWKDIPVYEGRYQASTEGRIRSVDHQVRGCCHYTGKPFTRTIKGRILRPGRYCKAGHVSVVLGKGTAGKPVHQLILLTFIGPCPEGKEVLHRNGDPTDNRLANLHYGTRRENVLDVYQDGGRWRKLSTEDVQKIRRRLDAGEKGRDIAEDFGVSESTVSSVKTGRTFGWL